MKVYESIALVSAELAHSGISKDRSNTQQGYKFRGIDDCLNALAPLLAKHRLVLLPEVLEREKVERETKQGGALFYVTVKVKYVFVNTEDFTRHDVITYGEAMDTADKATNKAMSAAYKYAVIQAFCIPTEGDNDADATTHEVKAAPDVTANKQKAQAKLNELQKKLAVPPAINVPASMPEAIWKKFGLYWESDPDRNACMAEFKENEGIERLASIQPINRAAFVQALQEYAALSKVPFVPFVG